jgi:hypothetical protein
LLSSHIEESPDILENVFHHQIFKSQQVQNYTFKRKKTVIFARKYTFEQHKNRIFPKLYFQRDFGAKKKETLYNNVKI